MIDHEMNKEKWLKAEKDLERTLESYLSEEEQIVRAAFKSYLADWTGLMLEGSFQRCESPIEKVLYIALFHSWYWKLYGFFLGNPTSLSFNIIPQKEIELDNRTIRVDFLIKIQQSLIDKTGEWHVLKQAQVVVECDGHDYHERTKEQAQRDRERDRLLQRYGYPILRFTGSEIYKDPLGCAEQIIEFLMESIDVWYNY